MKIPHIIASLLLTLLAAAYSVAAGIGFGGNTNIVEGTTPEGFHLGYEFQVEEFKGNESIRDWVNDLFTEDALEYVDSLISHLEDNHDVVKYGGDRDEEIDYLRVLSSKALYSFMDLRINGDFSTLDADDLQAVYDKYAKLESVLVDIVAFPTGPTNGLEWNGDFGSDFDADTTSEIYGNTSHSSNCVTCYFYAAAAYRLIHHAPIYKSGNVLFGNLESDIDRATGLTVEQRKDAYRGIYDAIQQIYRQEFLRIPKIPVVDYSKEQIQTVLQQAVDRSHGMLAGMVNGEVDSTQQDWLANAGNLYAATHGLAIQEYLAGSMVVLDVVNAAQFSIEYSNWMHDVTQSFQEIIRLAVSDTQELERCLDNSSDDDCFGFKGWRRYVWPPDAPSEEQVMYYIPGEGMGRFEHLSTRAAQLKQKVLTGNPPQPISTPPASDPPQFNIQIPWLELDNIVMQGDSSGQRYKATLRMTDADKLIFVVESLEPSTASGDPNAVFDPATNQLHINHLAISGAGPETQLLDVTLARLEDANGGLWFQPVAATPSVEEPEDTTPPAPAVPKQTIFAGAYRYIADIAYRNSDIDLQPYGVQKNTGGFGPVRINDYEVYLDPTSCSEDECGSGIRVVILRDGAQVGSIRERDQYGAYLYDNGHLLVIVTGGSSSGANGWFNMLLGVPASSNEISISPAEAAVPVDDTFTFEVDTGGPGRCCFKDYNDWYAHTPDRNKIFDISQSREFSHVVEAEGSPTANGYRLAVTPLETGEHSFVADLKGEADNNYFLLGEIKAVPAGTVVEDEGSAGGTTPPSIPAAFSLNDTGITWGGDYPSGNNPTCTGETITQQDCSHGRDATHNNDADGHAGFSFTKIDNGNCVLDNVTGLMWEVKTDDGGLHDKDDTYNWYNTDPATNGGADGYADDDGNICYGYQSGNSATYCNTQAYVARVNAAGWCGHHDWRMPNREELRSIVDYSRDNPAIDTDYFPNTRSSSYWSGSPNAYSSSYAWGVSFNHGYDGNYIRYSNQHVRLVRGGQ